MIPKKIHYCWFGGGKKSDLINKCINSWKIYCPDYEIIEWNESNFDVNQCNYVSQAYSSKKWAFVSDYARVSIIYEHGGIYLDTDVELIKNLDHLLHLECFFGYEDDKYLNTGHGFGSVKHHEALKQLLDDYEQTNFILPNGKLDLLPCPVRNSRILLNNNDLNFTVFSKSVFCPLDPNTRKLQITDETIGIHWFGESWISTPRRIKRAILRLFYRLKKT